MRRRSMNRFNPVAEYYEKIWHEKLGLPQYATLEKRWRSRWDFAVANISAGYKVLDVGCGDGILGESLIREKNCEVFGLDVSEYALSFAQERGARVTQCDASTDTFPFADNTFDAVTMSCLLEHIMHPEHALLEARRVVKPSGKIVITIPNAAYITNRLSILLGNIPLDFLHLNPGEGMHFHFFNYKDEFEKRVLSKIAGLRILKKEADLKNPKKYSPFRRRLMRVLTKLFPNLFGQYTHFVLEKEA
jgi:methionine biosynthesis protein MetW